MIMQILQESATPLSRCRLSIWPQLSSAVTESGALRRTNFFPQFICCTCAAVCTAFYAMTGKKVIVLYESSKVTPTFLLAPFRMMISL